MTTYLPMSRFIAQIKDGTHGTHERVDEGVPLLSAKNVQNGKLHVSEEESMISESEAAAIVANGFPAKNDILLTTVGTIGRSLVWTKEQPQPFQRSVSFIRLNKKQNPHYFKYYFESKYFQDQLGLLTKVSAQPGVYMGDILKVPGPLVDKEVQIKVAKYLDNKTQTLDKMIAAKKHTQALLYELRQSIITKLVYPSSGRNTSDTDQLYRHLVSQESGTWGVDPNDLNEVKCLRVADFDYEHLSHKQPETVRSIASDHMRTKLLRRGDVLIEKSGGGEKTPVGRAVIVGDLGEPSTYANFIDRLRFKSSVAPEYALYLLYAMYAGGVNTKYIKQNTGIQNLDIKRYLMEPVVISSVTEQKAVVDKIRNRLQKIDTASSKLSRSIGYLEEYRSSLISNVVDGKVEV